MKRIAVERDVRRLVDKSDVFRNELIGMSVYDPYLEKYVVDINADKYFTPASNTKLLTLYASELNLKDSIPTFAYTQRGDSLIIQPLGDPTFLHPDFEQQVAIQRLRGFGLKKLYIQYPEIDFPGYGPGWSWDDFGYAFQPERNAFPIYGNLVWVEQHSATKVTPDFFEDFVEFTEVRPPYRRDRNQNLFQFIKKSPDLDTLIQVSPFVPSRELVHELLADTLKAGISQVATQYSLPDTIFNGRSLPMTALMMLRSDNFLAEQMLYMAAVQKQSGSMEGFIHSMKTGDMKFAPDSLIWVDGSGLSRYNMLTPRTLVSILHETYLNTPWPEIEVVFPTGGVSGTIRSWYGAEAPYVFAKTGTLRHNHCLSGFIKTKSGKTLIFSFMNNHFTRSNAEIKRAMQTLLEDIRDSY
ncbi:MAG: D-alanyl-D-alanine carboxypeptidase [Cytophagales bacterium]|nr:D-alanyl-D-alanine carboxypeptidase [Cytophagales bacterium]